MCSFHLKQSSSARGDTLSKQTFSHYPVFLVHVFVHIRIRKREEAIFVPAQKCTYHVTFDLDLDLEHTLDAR